jgi:phosphinothricin acetyltransferase
MRIRHADAARDAAACAAIYAPFVRDGAVSFEEVPPSEPDFAERIERVMRNHPWLVAEHDGTVVGYAYASAHRSRAAYRWAAESAVYVDGAHRRSGVGRRLYTELLARLEEQGIQVVIAGVTLPNDASVRLHEALGFKPIGVYRRIGWKAGRWRDVGWWQLRLIEPEDSAEPPPEPSSPR